MLHIETLCNLRKNLRFLRRLHNMTQADAAKVINLSRSAYAAYETGTQLPSVITLKKIADFNNLKIDDLLSPTLINSMLGK